MGIDGRNKTLDECLVIIEECKQCLHTLATTARGLCKVHLRDRLINAEDVKDDDKCKAI